MTFSLSKKIPRVYPWIRVVRFLGAGVGLFLLWTTGHEMLLSLMHAYDRSALVSSSLFAARLALLLFALLLFPWRLIHDGSVWWCCYTSLLLLTCYALLPRFRVFQDAINYTTHEPLSTSALFVLQGFYAVVLCFQLLALWVLQHRKS